MNMIKKRILALLLAFMIILPELGQAFAEDLASAQKTAFLLPASLVEIEDEAFANTAVKTVVFQDGLLHIGDFAFENAQFLTDIYIPSSVRKIGHSAFPHRRNIVLHAPEKSYAQAWAKEHRVSYRANVSWSSRNDGRKTLRILKNASGLYRHLTDPKDIHIPARRIEVPVRSMRPQDRPELNPIDFRFP